MALHHAFMGNSFGETHGDLAGVASPLLPLPNLHLELVAQN